MIVRDFLNKSGRKVTTFKNNLPGIDWVNNFITRYKHWLSTRMCQNITKKRAEISTEVINKFFDNIAHVLQGVPDTNIINYDETNFTNDHGKSQMIFRRGIKYPERVMNFSKTSYSVMFAGSAAEELLPPYVVPLMPVATMSVKVAGSTLTRFMIGLKLFGCPSVRIWKVTMC
ncbi:hypothetical protein HAZT_HAZT008925 [Hyalella azteca]|uniref:DDE-1 domain-containing protein n=1 Tax=Hyalella azteca TaxID=294128 RepID=A0A6A0H5S6_HYAAZ|nr:hypothetical protein HAZT_HAZT008925 [Hyalella azteca]